MNLFQSFKPFQPFKPSRSQESEYLPQRAQRRNLVSELGAPFDLAQDMLGARKILFFVYFVPFPGET